MGVHTCNASTQGSEANESRTASDAYQEPISKKKKKWRDSTYLSTTRTQYDSRWSHGSKQFFFCHNSNVGG